MALWDFEVGDSKIQIHVHSDLPWIYSYQRIRKCTGLADGTALNETGFKSANAWVLKNVRKGNILFDKVKKEELLSGEKGNLRGVFSTFFSDRNSS